MSSHYEIEIKTLLGSKENAEKLRVGLKKIDPSLALTSSHSELNHYFTEPKSRKQLLDAILPILPTEKQVALSKLLTDAKTISIRSRSARGKILFIVKASVDDHTSSNGVSRIEFESAVEKTLDELDKILLSAGLTYQAKWSREREEYKSGNTNICIDRNAGYGYLAEFERLIDSDKEIASVKKELEQFMGKLGLSELSQERLERMFAHYNAHWPEYYGTDKIFTIE
ncbi:MAG: hypothetical protein A2664_04665 [Candidatus Taylorbacteria bacterium RIFCSPHIGHO2_01_FULL_46_22b]|uniref:CYTH domain-containing protein n=1 Tax=Candidatus Taylorbacteria bacterium RIFCSPHIGHO2_01_FULL_46_22b TaxID=1802301 RepID=A0A1G2M6T6_9BACT|nr:MAG: hypothetical protein A2664_04665 [Candidatus Taylorbacteria bacterium RIFCSPHIGHO2_01_FULL_46_22b]